MDSSGSSSSICVIGRAYLGEDGVSDLRLGGKLPQVSHDIGHFLLLDEVLLLVVEEGEALADLGLEVFLTPGLLSHGKVVIPQHRLYKFYRNRPLFKYFHESNK